jgi:hypothetical protein
MANPVGSTRNANLATESLGVHADKHQLPDAGAVQDTQLRKIKDQIIAGMQEFVRGLGQQTGFTLKAQSSGAVDYGNISNVFGFRGKTVVERSFVGFRKNGHGRTSPHGWIVSTKAFLFHDKRRFFQAAVNNG